MEATHVGKREWSGDEDGDVSDLGSDSNNEEDSDKETTKSSSNAGGLANVMASILNKQLPKHKQVILAKALTEKEVRKRKTNRKEAGENEEKDSDEDTENKLSMESLEKKKMWEEMGRRKPNPLEREKERSLQRIAQRGVVQLFNAVRKQQKALEEKMADVGPSERKQSKVMQNMTKGNFLDLLKETNVSSQVDGDEGGCKKKMESPPQEGKKWSILQEDFMVGGKMKDWDKQSSDEGNAQEQDSDIEDSDSDNG